jgi:5-methylcytosine-specific restriction enzyme subunit McrC
MRTIRLTEQEATRCRLTKTELALLLAAKRAKGGRLLSVAVRGMEEGVYEVRAGSVVGTLAWPGLQVLIRPKVGLENIFFLLGFRGALAQWGEDPFRYKREPDLLHALAWAFDAEVRRALRYGIARDYLTREETLVALRGRFDVGRQVQVRQDRASPVECRYQDYSEDITLNRLIKAAQRRLRGVPGLESELVRRLRHSGSAFTDVSDVEYPPTSVPEVLFTRLNRQWEPATRLALLILRQEALKDETGASVGISFTVDMNVLFEKFVEEVVRREAIRAGFRLLAQTAVRLTDRIQMRPDLTLRHDQRALAVGDAKYVVLEAAEWPHANLYQLLAYCVALRLPRGLLIYASLRAPELHRVTGAGIELEIVGIDMSVPPEKLLERARQAALRLVAHANTVRLASASAPAQLNSVTSVLPRP